MRLDALQRAPHRAWKLDRLACPRSAPCPLRRSCPLTHVCSTVFRRPLSPYPAGVPPTPILTPLRTDPSHPEVPLCPRLRRSAQARMQARIKGGRMPLVTCEPNSALPSPDVTTTLPPRRFWSLGSMWRPSACQRALKEMLDTHIHTCGARARMKLRVPHTSLRG